MDLSEIVELEQQREAATKRFEEGVANMKTRIEAGEFQGLDAYLFHTYGLHPKENLQERLQRWDGILAKKELVVIETKNNGYSNEYGDQSAGWTFTRVLIPKEHEWAPKKGLLIDVDRYVFSHHMTRPARWEVERPSTLFGVRAPLRLDPYELERGSRIVDGKRISADSIEMSPVSAFRFSDGRERRLVAELASGSSYEQAIVKEQDLQKARRELFYRIEAASPEERKALRDQALALGMDRWNETLHSHVTPGATIQVDQYIKGI